MSTRTNIAISLILLTCFGICSAKAESREVANASMVLPDGIKVLISTHLAPPSSHGQESEKKVYAGGGFRLTDKTIHRYFFDHRNNLYFGYDLVVEKLKDAGKFRISIEPLSVNPGVLDPMPREHTYALLTKVNFPPPQIVEDGDTLMFDVLVNARTQQKLTEKIRVSSQSMPFEARELEHSMIMVQGDLTLIPPTRNPDEPRDYTLDEVRLLLVNPILSVNGKEVYAGKGVTVFSSMHWIYVPGKGRLLLSIYPRQGYSFEKAGVIMDTKLSVTLDGDQYVVSSDKQIMASSNWNLYVLRQPLFQMPKGQEGNYTLGATGNIEE
jgi:hypothetical protein